MECPRQMDCGSQSTSHQTCTSTHYICVHTSSHSNKPLLQEHLTLVNRPGSKVRSVLRQLSSSPIIEGTIRPFLGSPLPPHPAHSYAKSPLLVDGSRELISPHPDSAALRFDVWAQGQIILGSNVFLAVLSYGPLVDGNKKSTRKSAIHREESCRMGSHFGLKKGSTHFCIFF